MFWPHWGVLGLPGSSGSLLGLPAEGPPGGFSRPIVLNLEELLVEGEVVPDRVLQIRMLSQR
jgi:hypothetical protein